MTSASKQLIPGDKTESRSNRGTNRSHVGITSSENTKKETEPIAARRWPEFDARRWSHLPGAAAAAKQRDRLRAGRRDELHNDGRERGVRAALQGRVPCHGGGPRRETQPQGARQRVPTAVCSVAAFRADWAM